MCMGVMWERGSLCVWVVCATVRGVVCSCVHGVMLERKAVCVCVCFSEFKLLSIAPTKYDTSSVCDTSASVYDASSPLTCTYIGFIGYLCWRLPY